MKRARQVCLILFAIGLIALMMTVGFALLFGRHVAGMNAGKAKQIQSATKIFGIVSATLAVGGGIGLCLCDRKAP